ncbi:MAG TPA: methyltransferase domain-containing protein [Vicinamibacterales bacterium]
MLSDDELAQLYGAYTKKVASADEDDLLFTIAAAEAETLTASQTRFLAEHVEQPAGRVLDIGCGKGAFLRSFKARRPGWQCVGIEPSREEAALARADGQLEVHEGMLGSTPLPGDSFDLISIMHVLEHVPRPLEALRQIRDWLKPGGLVFIEVPNTADLNMFYDLLLFEHLYHFTPETLAWLLTREGFEVVVHERSTSYGAQRVIARKATRPASVAWPLVTMAEGFARWERLWNAMTQLAEHGAAAARSGKRVGIFGAGMTAATWLVHTSLSGAPLIGLFDESPWKIGQTLFDRAIHPLATIREYRPDLILVATMPNSQQLVTQKLAAACESGTEIRGFGATG